jgi:molecular chaperone IbpA
MNELDIIRNHFLGFHNDFFDGFKRVSTYPPYNIRGNSEKGFIEMALAGFTEKYLTVEVKDNCLTIQSSPKDSEDSYLLSELSEENPRYLIHRGISKRSFIKKFQLHKYVVVDGAEFKDGMLTVNYHMDIPESEKPKQIEIKSKK